MFGGRPLRQDPGGRRCKCNCTRFGPTPLLAVRRAQGRAGGAGAPLRQMWGRGVAMGGYGRSGAPRARAGALGPRRGRTRGAGPRRDGAAARDARRARRRRPACAPRQGPNGRSRGGSGLHGGPQSPGPTPAQQKATLRFGSDPRERPPRSGRGQHTQRNSGRARSGRMRRAPVPRGAAGPRAGGPAACAPRLRGLAAPSHGPRPVPGARAAANPAGRLVSALC
jgi:hypothetical protein